MEAIEQTRKYREEELIPRILLGETGLYEIIIRRYNPVIYKIGRSYGFSHADTEDLMQETYLNAYSALQSFTFKSAFKTWLIRIMLNHCYKRKSLKRFQQEVLTGDFNHLTTAPMFTDQEGTAGRISRRELARIVEQALQNLPEQYRVVFTLRELNGLNTAEAAQATGVTESNVKVRLNRARQMLRKEIEQWFAPEDIYEFNLIYCDKMVDLVMNRINTENLKP